MLARPRHPLKKASIAHRLRAGIFDACLPRKIRSQRLVMQDVWHTKETGCFPRPSGERTGNTAQDENEYHENERDEHEVTNEYGGNTTAGNGNHRYDQLHEIDFTDIPRPVSPLRASDEYDEYECPPSNSSTFEQGHNPKDSSIIQYSSYPPSSTWPDSARSRMWQPIWLSKTILVVFAGTFAAMMLATGLLYHFSVKNHGISVQEEVNHYGWKYGPTALLVVVGAFWRQVDHHNKMLMPWKELRDGPSPIHKTLLLDYITPILPTALWDAAKNRHWAVVMSTLGHLLILGTTVFSTGLLILESTTVTKESSDFVLKSEFQLKDPSDAALPLKVGPAAAQLYYGIHFQGLHYPPGTSEDIVVPELQLPPGSSDNLNYTLSMEGMKIDLDCEILPITNGTATHMPWRSILASFFTANVTTPECNITGVTLAEGPDHNFYEQPNATQNYQAQFDFYPCNVDWDFANQYVESDDYAALRMLYNISADQRLLLSVTDLRFSKRNVSRNEPDYLYINEVTVALCKPLYSLNQFEVRSASILNGSAQAVLSSAEPKGEAVLKGLPTGGLSLGVYSAVDSFSLGTGGDDYVLSEVVPTFFQLMGMKNGNSSLGAFMDPNLMIETATNVFKGIATQLLRQITLQPTDRKIAGEMTYTADRLQVKALSTGFMCGFLGVLTLLALGMIFVRPHAVVPHEPGSIASTATMLAASPLLHRTLLHTEGYRRSQLRKRLEIFNFRTVVNPGPESVFSIEPIQEGKDKSLFAAADQDSQSIHWWRPAAATAWFLALAIGLPLVLIAILQVIQHLSDQNSGFVNVGQTNSVVLSTYIPAAVALGIASMYSALELMAAIFAPFDALKRGRATATRSIGLNVVGKLLPHAAFLSFRSRQFAVIVALLGNFIGGFLTIVVSGLYSTVQIPILQDVTIHQLDAFNFEGVDLSLNDGQAAAIDSLIEYLDLGYPKWTHDSLVFNHFGAPNTTFKNSSTTAPLTVNVPVTQPKLNCTTILNKDRLITFVNDDQSQGSMGTEPGQSSIFTPVPGYVEVGFNTTLDFETWCETPPSDNYTSLPWMQYFLVPMNKQPAYIGKASVMAWYSDNIIGDGAIDTNPTSGSGIGSRGISTGGFGCPTFSVTFGTLRVTDSKTVGNNTEWNFEHDLATLMCYQNIEEVTANVTWEIPDFAFGNSTLPTVDESTASLLKNKNGSHRFEFAVNAWLMTLSDSVYNRTLPGPNGTEYSNNDVDEFIKAAVNSKDSRPLDEIVGSKNVDNLEKVATQLYQTYMAQAISINMRSNSTSEGSMFPSYTGNLTTAGHRRLRQNKSPKIALQAMLATMVACAIATTLLIRVREVLPHNPCSIAGTASMLAGGEIATRPLIPFGAEWRSDRELREVGVFENDVYSLKLWDGRDGSLPPRKRYGIDVDRPGNST
ncbi:hypothetical protein G7046_g2643 [Stylonectria norvegica]|nr:hypothetical protein G7046_g2643 [Stylonectria norvegica]